MPEHSTAVDAIADRLWERFLELSPITATTNGDHRYDDRLPDPGPAGRASFRQLAHDAIAAAETAADEAHGVEDAITLDMLRVVGERILVEDEQRLDTLQVVDQMGGPQTLLPQLCRFQAADTPERLELFIARLHAYPAFMDANTELLREAIASGLTAPRIVAERVVAQMERMLAIPPDESVIGSLVEVASEADRDAIRRIVRDVVYPSDAAFLETLRDRYLPHTRTEPGLWSAPHGDELYRTQIRHWTTLDLDPSDVHQRGLDELVEIEEERRSIARDAGFGGDTRAYREAILQEPRNIPASQKTLIARAEEDVARATEAATRVFGTLPRAECAVLPVEEYKERDAPFAYYFPPSADGARPGTFYVNTYDLPSRAYSRLAATTFHESVPGHHLQIALETENVALNRFRRFGSRLVAGAYIEGWGLYAERLADELGLYRNEAERFGMLDAQAWRAGRLVVDSGMHALRWTRQQSIDLLLEIGLSETDAVIETDRYICWPAQALTYKTGQREIERLRAELAARDGSRFDLKLFHDQLLGHGSLPLATLTRELPTWVAETA